METSGEAGGAPTAAQLAERFLRSVLPQRLDGAQHAPGVARLCGRVGWARLQPALATLLQASMAKTHSLGQATALLQGLLEAHQRQRRRQQQQHQGAPQPTAADSSTDDAHAALAHCCGLLVDAACSKLEAGSAPQAETVAQLLHCLASLGGQQQLQQAQRLLPHAVAQVQACTVPALLRLRRRFGWAAIRPAAEQLAARCAADSAALPPAVSLLRQLAEAAASAGVAGGGGAGGSGGSSEQQQPQQQPPPPPQQQQQQQDSPQAGKENAPVAGQGAQPPQAAKQAEPAACEQGAAGSGELPQQLAGLLAALLDVALREPDLGPHEAQGPRQPAFLVDAFAAVHALLPAAGAAEPLLPSTAAASSGGQPLQRLADRLARLAAAVAQRERRYPPAACLQPACKALHALLGQRAEAGAQCRGVWLVAGAVDGGQAACARSCSSPTHYSRMPRSNRTPLLQPLTPRCWR